MAGSSKHNQKLHEFRMAQLHAELHETRGQRLMKKTENGYYNGTGEAEVVPGYQLQNELQAWERRYKVDRNHKEEPHHVYDRTVGHPVKKATVMGPTEWLAWETGIHKRRVTGIKNGEFQVVPLSQAEKLLMAIDREYMLATGEIQVIPNPNWSPESWRAYMEERGCI